MGGVSVTLTTPLQLITNVKTVVVWPYGKPFVTKFDRTQTSTLERKVDVCVRSNFVTNGLPYARARAVAGRCPAEFSYT